MELNKKEILSFIGECYPEKGYGDSENLKITYLRELVSQARKLNVHNLKIHCSLFLSTTIDDKKASYELLKQLYNQEVAEIVFLLSKPLSRNYKEEVVNQLSRVFTNKDAFLCYLIILIKKTKDSIKSKASNSIYFKEVYLKLNPYFLTYSNSEFFFLFKIFEKLIKENYEL